MNILNYFYKVNLNAPAFSINIFATAAKGAHGAPSTAVEARRPQSEPWYLDLNFHLVSSVFETVLLNFGHLRSSRRSTTLVSRQPQTEP
jgi:hypothetical protein